MQGRLPHGSSAVRAGAVCAMLLFGGPSVAVEPQRQPDYRLRARASVIMAHACSGDDYDELVVIMRVTLTNLAPFAVALADGAQNLNYYRAFWRDEHDLPQEVAQVFDSISDKHVSLRRDHLRVVGPGESVFLTQVGFVPVSKAKSAPYVPRFQRVTVQFAGRTFIFSARSFLDAQGLIPDIPLLHRGVLIEPLDMAIPPIDDPCRP